MNASHDDGAVAERDDTYGQSRRGSDGLDDVVRDAADRVQRLELEMREIRSLLESVGDAGFAPRASRA